jgi:hypothetical protein
MDAEKVPFQLKSQLSADKVLFTSLSTDKIPFQLKVSLSIDKSTFSAEPACQLIRHLFSGKVSLSADKVPFHLDCQFFS